MERKPVMVDFVPDVAVLETIKKNAIKGLKNYIIAVILFSGIIPLAMVLVLTLFEVSDEVFILFEKMLNNIDNISLILFIIGLFLLFSGEKCYRVALKEIANISNNIKLANKIRKIMVILSYRFWFFICISILIILAQLTFMKYLNAIVEIFGFIMFTYILILPVLIIYYRYGCLKELSLALNDKFFSRSFWVIIGAILFCILFAIVFIYNSAMFSYELDINTEDIVGFSLIILMSIVAIILIIGFVLEIKHWRRVETIKQYQ